jgi:two-component system nitrogen regulation sensor histidine kinase GlnL
LPVLLNRRKKLRGITAASPVRLQNVLASLGDAVILTDEDDRITLFNQAAEELTGVPEAQALQRPCGAIFAGTPTIAPMVERTRALGQSQSCGEETLSVGRRRVPVRVSCSAIWGPEGNLHGVALVIQDLSYQKKLEDEARRNETLARLGGLVAGLAHEVKNPLGGIKGAAQLLAKRFADQPEIGEYTGVMIREIDRLSRLVEQLLTLGAPVTPNLVSINVHKILHEVRALMATELAAKHIAVRLEIDPSLPDVRGEEAQLTHVFLNLVKNAIEAMPEHGTLTITTRMETDFHILRRAAARAADTHAADGGRGAGRLSDATEQRIGESAHDGSSQRPIGDRPIEKLPGAAPAPAPGKFLRVEIADTGPGFPDEDVERVFEPFFTTKPRGSGLGLAICERIVAVHGGDIRAENRARGGAAITVTLPVIA